MFVFLQDLSFSGSDVMLGSVFVLGSALLYSFYLIGSGELIKRVGATRLVAYALSVSSAISMPNFFSLLGLSVLLQPFTGFILSLGNPVCKAVSPPVLDF